LDDDEMEKADDGDECRNATRDMGRKKSRLSLDMKLFILLLE